MSFQYNLIENIGTNPVTIAELKAFCRIDADYAGDDVSLQLILDSATSQLENYLNIFFFQKKIEAQFFGGCFVLPFSPFFSIESVIKKDETEPITDYTINGLNVVTLNMSNSSSVGYFYPMNGGVPEIWQGITSDDTYNVTYITGSPEGKLPAQLKHALLTQCDYAYKNLGDPDFAPMSPVALQIASQYSNNLVI